jgi:hypothetical protein
LAAAHNPTRLDGKSVSCRIRDRKIPVARLTPLAIFPNMPEA